MRQSRLARGASRRSNGRSFVTEDIGIRSIIRTIGSKGPGFVTLRRTPLSIALTFAERKAAVRARCAPLHRWLICRDLHYGRPPKELGVADGVSFTKVDSRRLRPGDQG
jgi:hypothetical protein